MKTTLLSKQKNLTPFLCLLALCLSFSIGWSQNLMQNPTCDEWTVNTTDNADAYDVTPNNTIVDNSNMTITSPYQTVWDNDALDDYLEATFNGGSGVDEQPGSTSSGAGGTRGIKLFMDTSPNLPGVSTRRIYQKVEGLMIGTDYVFSVQSRSEAMNVPSEVFILNEEITTEVGLENGATDSRVDAFMSITNDFNSDSSVFTTSTLNFTATTTSVVVYIRAQGAVNGSTEVFYDNFSLVEDSGLSTENVLASKFRIYPNPANDFVNIIGDNVRIESTELFDLLGKQVFSARSLTNGRLDISSMAKGVYVLKINSDAGSLTRKIVIK